MEWITVVLRAAAADPLTAVGLLIGLVAGSGGLMYWWDRWRQRPQVSSRVLQVGQNRLVIEVENTSPNPNSLRPEVLVSGFDILYGAETHRCEVEEEDRSLPPFQPRRFTLVQREKGSRSDDIRFLHFPLVRVAASRGRPRILRFRRFTEITALTWWRYWSQRLPQVMKGRRIVDRGYRGFQVLAQEHEDRQGPAIQGECSHCATLAPLDIEFADIAANPDGSTRWTCAACGGESTTMFDRVLIVAEEDGEPTPE